MIDDLDHDRPATASTIKVYPSGTYFDPLNPRVEDVHLADIAHGLAHICRYGGHVASFYSVAEHSLHVSAQVWRTFGDKEVALAALLHDATEAYIGDVVRPLKNLLPEYKEIEHRLARVIEQKFGLKPHATEAAAIKVCDNGILPWEMAMIRDCKFREPSSIDLVTHRFTYGALDLGAPDDD